MRDLDKVFVEQQTGYPGLHVQLLGQMTMPDCRLGKEFSVTQYVVTITISSETIQLRLSSKYIAIIIKKVP
jgi:hypothetical protein